MSDTTKQEKKVSRFSQVKSEFKKIIWPSKQSAAKQTFAVVVISIVLGLLITVLDTSFQFGINQLLKL